MSHIDDILQHFRDALGVKSMSQLDAEDEAKQSAYLQKQPPVNAGHPVLRQGHDVYFDPIQMQPQEGNTGETYPGPYGPMPLVQRPGAQMQPMAQMDHPPSSLAPRSSQEILESLASVEGKNGGGRPLYEPGNRPEEDLYFSGKGQMMSPGEAQDYIDFLNPPNQDDDDYGSPAIADMR